MVKIWFGMLAAFWLLKSGDLPDSKRAADARTTVWPRLEKELTTGGFDSKCRIYLRIFKESHLLEVWAKKGSKFEMFKRYDICYFSGGLGTKRKRGDGKSPEGFYTITAGQLNPMSNYHLAINIGYPNRLEQQNGCTGDAIMIHGKCASIGCYAMTDTYIEEIYTMVYKALDAGQNKVQLDIFPFYMDDAHMKSYARWPDILLWKTMRPAYNYFQQTHMPPPITVANKQYVLQ